MKLVSNDYKNAIKSYGKQIDSIIDYTIDDTHYYLYKKDLNSISVNYNGSILKSIMKELKIDSNVDIPLETIIRYQFGVLTDESNENPYEYINMGNYVVYKSEKKEDTNSYEITCYDKMLYSMKDYEALEITYPITIRDYLSAICTHLGLTFNDASNTFANYNRQIPNELYLDADGNSLGYTFRDVLDEIAQATASTICINDEDKLEVRYISKAERSKNLLNTDDFVNGYYSGNRYIEDNDFAMFDCKIPIKENQYIFSANTNVRFLNITYFNENDEYVGQTSTTNRSYSITQNIPTGASYFRLAVCKDLNTTMTSQIIDSLELMVEVGNERTEYEPYVYIETIDEHSLKNINVNFGKKYGPINSIVLSRADSDNIYLQDEDSVEENGLCEIKIIDNQIMNGNDRDEYLPDILEELDGLEYYLNDYSSTGISYLELCDRYIVQIGDNEYSCVMFNDELNITQGLEENIHTDMPEETETDYTKADKTDRRLNQTTLIVDKHEQEIQALISKTVDITDITEGNGTITLEGAYEGILHELIITGNMALVYPNDSEKYGYSLMISDDLVVSDDIYISSGVPYQNDTTYPETTLYPKDSYLQVDETLYKLDIDYLNYLSLLVHDRYVYEDGKQWIERHVGIDENGDMYPLDTPVKELKSDLEITIGNNSVITFLSFPNARLKSEYLLKNKYTQNFAPYVYVDSEIKQTADEINMQVREKVSEDEIIAKINLAVENEQGIINITGNQVIIDSDNFHLDAEGNIECQDAIMDDTTMNTAIINDATMYNVKVNKGNIMLESTPGHIDPSTGQWVGPEVIEILNSTDPTNKYMYLSSGQINIYNENNSQISHAQIQGHQISLNEGSAYMTLSSTVNTGIQISNGGTGLLTYLKYNESQVNGNSRATGFVNISEEDKKKNIKKVEKGLEILKDIDIYTYNYNDEKKSAKKHYGTVIGDKYKYSTEITDEKNEGVDLYSFISICCKSIQEQQEQIEELQKEIKSLKEEKDGKDKLSK